MITEGRTRLDMGLIYYEMICSAGQYDRINSVVSKKLYTSELECELRAVESTSNGPVADGSG